MIGIFAVRAGLISGLFSVNESKDIVTTASKIHGVSAAINFMALLFFSLLNWIVTFKQKDIMGDKEYFQNTILKYEGLWERLTLFCMYVPFIYRTISNLLF